MIDYKTIGNKLRIKRLHLKMSQEKLAELCDVGTTHISHIETGNCIPSLKVFISIINALGITADEILCNELDYAEHAYKSELFYILEDCTSRELMIITNTVATLKNTLRR